MMKLLNISSRIILGLVFIFSGFVKAVDPLGSAYKFHDYFFAFGIGFLDFLSLPLAIILCTAEFMAGVSLVTGLRLKTGIWVTLLFMLVFTPLTLILALTNPVSDCGCFGDAVHLTNWQTFGKNIVLLIPALFLFLERKKTVHIFSSSKEWLLTGLITGLFILFPLYNLRYLPVIDFLPYKKGVKIADKMVIPEGVEPDIYNTTFIYEKDGVKKEFTLSDYPANDSTWIFVDQKSVLVKKGYIPPIHDFSITTTEGTDITQKLLSNQGFTLIMISKKLEKAEKKRLEKGFDTGKSCISAGIDFLIVTASASGELQEFENGLTFCTADETTLKTIVRANPGYILLKDGVIVGKWSWANLPEKEWFGRSLLTLYAL